MARTFTVAQLVERVRQRADMPTVGFVEADELLGYISASYTELYDLLVRAGLSYFESTQTVTIATTGTIALPDDYYGTVGVDYRYDSENFAALRELMPQERNIYQTATGQAHAYRIVGANLVLYPTPTAGQVYRHIYVPAPANLTSGAQTVDGVSGWEELIVVDAAIKCLMKEESDVRGLMAERSRLIARIEEAAENRRTAGNARIVDVEGGSVMPGDYWPRGGGPR